MGKRGSRFLFGLAGALALAAGAGTANAYFTTFAEAQGGVVIRLGDRTEIEEACSEWTKSIVITSNPDSQPVYIRARAFCGSVYELEYISPSGKWTLNEADGFYYYNDIVYGGASTDVLEIKIGNIPETPEPGQGFNVAVIYESTPVRYHAGGEAYADWTVILDSGAAEDADAEGESGAEQSPEEGNTGAAEDESTDSGAGEGGAE